MSDARPDNPYWQSRATTEAVFKSQGLVPGKHIDQPNGQHWHIKGGITFSIQWLGQNLDYVDAEAVAYILKGVADWRAKNPPNYS